MNRMFDKINNTGLKIIFASILSFLLNIILLYPVYAFLINMVIFTSINFFINEILIITISFLFYWYCLNFVLNKIDINDDKICNKKLALIVSIVIHITIAFVYISFFNYA